MRDPKLDGVAANSLHNDPPLVADALALETTRTHTIAKLDPFFCSTKSLQHVFWHPDQWALAFGWMFKRVPRETSERPVRSAGKKNIRPPPAPNPHC